MGRKKRSTLVVMILAGLSGRLLASGKCPNLKAHAQDQVTRPLRPVLPALTLPMQATFMTGALPSEHGIVGNGFFDRNWLEHRFWNASGKLLEAPPLWRTLQPGKYRAGALFWWHCLGSGLDLYLNVAPIHTASGETWPACYSDPPGIYPMLEERFGPFPLHRFWGPGISIESSAWILAATREILAREELDVLFTYLPHMDYSLQRSGPDSEEASSHLEELDGLLSDFLVRAREDAFDLVLLSEYGITPVRAAVSPNRILRKKGFFRVRKVRGREFPDLAGSRAFALCDHQVAHVYIKDQKDLGPVAQRLRDAEGVGSVLDSRIKAREGLDHLRAGELVALSAPDHWFEYPWWDDPSSAPDYAFTVDIHRKIGYDPLELIGDRKRGGIATEPALIKGSHGLIPGDPMDLPLIVAPGGMGENPFPSGQSPLPAEDVKQVLGNLLAGR
ncbi:MAG: alkaline phosphatase family protein [Planctomycetota bacterium]